MIREAALAAAFLSLAACSSAPPPTDYSHWTVNQCFALARWPYTGGGEESRCIDAVFHTTEVGAEQRQLDFEQKHADIRQKLEEYQTVGAAAAEAAGSSNDAADTVDDMMLCNGLYPRDSFAAWECYNAR